MNVEINLDLSESLATVFGVCDAAYGQGNATTPAGAVLKINFTGQFCTDFSTMTFGGPWWVSGGTLGQAQAGGTGTYALSGTDSFGTNPSVFTMRGVYRKTP